MSLSPFINAGGEWTATATATTTGTSQVTVPLDVEQSNFGGVAVADLVTNNTVTILVSGFYSIDACWGIDAATSARMTSLCFIDIDTGGGFGPMLASIVFGYHRSTNDGENSMSRRIVRKLNKGDILRMVFRRNSGTLTLASKATGCGLSLTFLSVL